MKPIMLFLCKKKNTSELVKDLVWKVLKIYFVKYNGMDEGYSVII